MKFYSRLVCRLEICSFPARMKVHSARLAAVLVGVAAVGCATLHQNVPVDPAATFAAHQEHRELVIDRLGPGRSGTLRPAGWLRLPGSPTFLLQADGDTIAALWLSGARVVVRQKPSEAAPLVGEVVPSWQDGAVQLTLQPAGGPALRTDHFVRMGVGSTPTLTRAAQTVLDLRGSYEGTVRDANGGAVGWFRVRLGPYLPAPRIFEAALPAAVPSEIVAAAAAALDAEVDWIEDHVLNVYRGSGGGGLEQSIPLPR